MKRKNNTIEPKKLWGGRFADPMSKILETTGESISFDHKLYEADIQGSKAHVKMLAKCGIVTQSESASIQKGLEQIRLEIQNGAMEFKPELEDIHMHIESRLIEIIGETGKKLHTARSRNDQVAHDVRSYIQTSRIKIGKKLSSLLKMIYARAEKSIQLILPGYTHLQVAQPIRASHYLLSWFWAFERDRALLQDNEKINDVLVLGSGALAGVNYNTDRDFLWHELGMLKCSENSIDSVSHRDHIHHYLYCLSMILLHASRLCEEFILYSSFEFSYIRLPDSLTSGSSIMPQKKNPDLAELIRGKAARVIGALNQSFLLVKNLPLAYNRDLQEDKIPLFDASEQAELVLDGLYALIKGFEFNEKNLSRTLISGFSTATDLADFLVTNKSIPFREAHELVGSLVKVCSEKGETLFSLPESERKKISLHFTGPEYLDAISLEKSADKKISYGGTAKARQKEQLKLARKKLSHWEKIDSLLNKK